MATGPEHYDIAEQILDQLAERADEIDVASINAGLASARVHATLALAAATAMGSGNMADLDFDAWDQACGVQLDAPAEAAT